MKYIIYVLYFLTICTAASGDEAGLKTTDFYVRETPPTIKTTAAYGKLLNRSKSSLIISEISSPQAKTIEIHSTKVDEKGMVEMDEVTSLRIPPGKSVRFEPGGLHIMVMGLKNPLKAGEQLEVDITFSKGKPLKLMIPVRKL
ncbi:MAG: copper chaperone PCu(A)C [Pseudobacteriovorax sp.]|nr:copper chaperone PCu(A)C [Pseudobacteriovorax sp.]